MILHELRIEGFGCLTGEIRFSPDRLNLVVGPNEAGKTTLAAAVVAALYGLEEDRRAYRDRLTPREQYEPWDGRPYALELVFEVDGTRYTVNRHFGRGTVTVHAEGRGEVSEDFRTGLGGYRMGEILLDLTLDQFVRSAFWIQPGPGRLAGAEVRPDASLASMLERRASSVAGDASAQAAIEVLEGALRQYALSDTRILVTNHVKRLAERIEARGRELAGEEERLEKAGLALGRLQEARRRRAALEDERQRAAAQLCVLALAETDRLLSNDTQARLQWVSLRGERETLARVPGIDPKAAEKLRRSQFEREAATRGLEELERRREAEWTAPTAELARDLEANRAFSWAVPVHVQELAEIRRARERNAGLAARAQEKLEVLREELRQAGVAVERLEELQSTFAELGARDAQLLTQYAASALSSATARQSAEREVEVADAGMRAIRKERSLRRWTGGLLVALGLAAAAGSVGLALRGDATLSFVGLSATLVALAVGSVLLFRASLHRATERQELLRALTTAQRHLQQVREQAAEREVSLADVAHRLGRKGGETLLHDHADYQRLVRETERLAWVQQELEGIATEEARLRRAAWGWAKRAEMASAEADPPAAWDLEAALDAVHRGIETRLKLTTREQSLAEIRRRLDEDEKGLRAKLDAALEAARAVVRELGMPEDDRERALAELEARRQARERLETLNRLLPDLEKRILPEGDMLSARDERERLTQELELVRAAHPEWLVLPEGVTSRAEAARRGKTAERALETLATDLERLEREVGSLERQGGQRASELRVEIADLVREKRRAERFQDSVQIAIETWKRVARETHALWSEYLTRRVNEFLPALGPQLRGFQVTDGLEYSLVVEGQRFTRDKLEQMLSAGTRDQLALAIRVAICEFLTRRGRSVPLLFDDPFAMADDERAEAGLRFLGDAVAYRHQVIVLTCHRERLAAVGARRPEWFAERVHRIELPLEPASLGASAAAGGSEAEPEPV